MYTITCTYTWNIFQQHLYYAGITYHRWFYFCLACWWWWWSNNYSRNSFPKIWHVYTFSILLIILISEVEKKLWRKHYPAVNWLYTAHHRNITIIIQTLRRLKKSSQWLLSLVIISIIIVTFMQKICCITVSSVVIRTTYKTVELVLNWHDFDDIKHT